MTRVSRDFMNTMQKAAVPAVSAVIFWSSRFLKYKLGAGTQAVEGNVNGKTVLLKDVVVRENAQLFEQKKRQSVRDLASKFEKGGWPSLAKLKEADSLEKHLLLKKLRDALEAIRGHVTDENKDDVEVFLAMTKIFSTYLQFFGAMAIFGHCIFHVSAVWNQRRWKCYSPSIYLASKTRA